MIDEGRLADLLEETGRRHHQAFITADGEDPEWPKWYAGYLQAQIWDGFETVPSQSELIYLLVGAEKAHAAEGSEQPWPAFYARFLLDHLTNA